MEERERLDSEHTLVAAGYSAFQKDDRGLRLYLVCNKFFYSMH